MSSPQSVMAFSVSALLLASSPATGQQRERSQVPLRYQWNLADLYPNDDSWRTGKAAVTADIEKLEQHKGTLASSPAAMRTALDGIFGCERSSRACTRTHR